MAERQLKLRYPAVCAVCSTRLPPGSSAWWDSTTKVAACTACHVGEAPKPRAEPEEQGVAGGPPPAIGAAGASAQRIYDKRAADREARVRSRFPRIGGALVRLVDEPESTKAWAKGASGERLVANRLDAIADDGVISLHDRRIPRSRANIDHIAVTPTGIHVIDTKRYTGRLEQRDVGGWLKRDERLYVNGRDRTPLAEKVNDQANTVRAALHGEFTDVPVWPVLCFVDVDIAVLTRPFVVRGVSVTWPRALQKRLRSAGSHSQETVAAVAALLGGRLPPA